MMSTAAIITRGIHPMLSSGMCSARSAEKFIARRMPITQPAMASTSRMTPRMMPTMVESARSAMMIQSISVICLKTLAQQESKVSVCTRIRCGEVLSLRDSP